jgi:ATP synthase F1 gamma subunit
MRKPQEVAEEERVMGTIVSLTGAFEGIASMRISQIKNQVLKSEQFFGELWQIYTQLRVDKLFRFGREKDDTQIDKELIIAITAEGGFSGDIDQKLMAWMLKYYEPAKHDIIIIGHHGALQLLQAGIKFKKYYKLPTSDQNINVKPLVGYIKQYRETTVFYQTYISLMVQDIKKIELQKAVQDAGSKVKEEKDVISESNYIFEPSSFAVVAHLERSMVEVCLSQVILDSKLAQYASRFRAMNVANDRAVDSYNDLHLLYRRTKRNLADERLKEIMNGMKKAATL